MPPHIWQVETTELIQAFESQLQNTAAGTLIRWAVWTVDCLHYLDDLDREFDVTHSSFADHRPDVIDVAHARWATGTCITALDLCAATLGRAYCKNIGKREYDLGYFDYRGNTSRSPIVDARRDQLPLTAQKWLDDVLADPDYEVIKNVRDWLTHSRVNRHFYLTIGGPPQRLRLELSTGQMQVRQIIELARDLATKHVSIFLQNLMQFQ